MHQLRRSNPRLTEDYSNFGSRAYLEEYYSAWDIEDSFSQSFFHEAYRFVEPQETLLEIGGGPTIYQLISARRKVNSIVFTDYLKENRQEILAWKHCHPGMFNWDAHFKHVQELEKGSSQQSVEEMKEELRTKLSDIRHFDILKKRQFLPRKQFDVVSMQFCSEAISKDEADFLTIMRNVTSRARSGGILIMSFLKEAQMYPVGEMMFCVYPLTEMVLRKTMSELNCEIMMLVTGPAVDEREYAGTMSLLARRR